MKNNWINKHEKHIENKLCYKLLIEKEEPKQSIIKTEKDAKIFIEALENIPEPNEKLKKAFKDFHKKETTLEEAKKYLSNEGYGTGSNFTLNNVANLMIKWQQEQNKKN